MDDGVVAACSALSAASTATGSRSFAPTRISFVHLVIDRETAWKRVRSRKGTSCRPAWSTVSSPRWSRREADEFAIEAEWPGAGRRTVLAGEPIGCFPASASAI